MVCKECGSPPLTDMADDAVWACSVCGAVNGEKPKKKAAPKPKKKVAPKAKK